MIIPHKYMNLELSVINIAADIIKIVKDSQVVQFDEVLIHLRRVHGDDVSEIFHLALTFLFAMGKIDYYKDIDSIEFLQ